ncbi:DUF748 domain-containing protein [Azonexus caeni]|uniref:DUF748 domain-containing protein n=1 Tax=Azonexus caeni TaxID=266126 RepID=UPI003A8C0EE0
MTAARSSALNKLARWRTRFDTPPNRRRGKWLVGGLLAFVLFGFFAAPPLLKSLLLDKLGEALHREVSIARIDVNPLALSATVAGLAVRTAEGREVAGFDELYVNLSASSLLKFAVVVDEIRLVGPRLAVVRLDEGRYDVSDLLDEWLKPDDEPDSGVPRFSLNNIQLSGGKLVFDDRPRGRVHTAEEINLGLPFVSSLPYQAEILVQPMFSARLDGSELRLDGQATPFADGRESELNLQLNGFDLAQLQPYLPAGVPLRIGAARLHSQLRLVFRELTDGANSLTLTGQARLDGLALSDDGGRPLVGWKSLLVDLEQFDPFKRNLALRKVTLDGAELDLAVDGRGELNLLTIAQRLARPAALTVTPAAPVAPFAWSLAAFELNDARVRWRDASGPQPVSGEIGALNARLGAVDHRLAAPLEIAEAGWQMDFGTPLKVGSVGLKALRVDLAAQRVEIGELALSGARIAAGLAADGSFVWLTPPVLRGVAQGGKAPAPRPWLAQVAKLKVDDLGLRFEDQSVQPAAVQEISGLSLQGERLGNLPNEKGRLTLQATVNGEGKLAVGGEVQAVPLAAKLQIDSSGIPVQGLQAYSGRYLNIRLQRGQFSNQGEAVVRVDGGRLKAAYKGSATIGNLLAVDPDNKADFLKWKSLHFGGVDFRLDPLAIDVREIALADFYSRLILNKDGRLNLADIVRRNEAAPVAAADAAAAPVNPPPVAAATTPAAPPVPIRIAKVTLNNGTVNFSDYFVKPNYTVNVGKLNGRVSGLSSAAGTLADMELRGTYAGSAPVLISARLNPLAAQSFLDLKGEVKGVDMTGFSPYSGKYAGYLIDKGKLSLNVAYKLENRQLSADNRLFIDQFTFGERVDSPDATKLPVNLALALLRNNRGEIDINLPISGSLDDPQFSVGGLVIKVIVNLFVKAVTSPFALIGSLFGGGEELSTLAFAPGRTQFDAAAQKKLETLARALTERAALKLEIAGYADPEIDSEGVRRVAIERAMQREKFADLQKKGGDAESADAVRIAPEEYKTYLVRVYKAGKFPKPRNFIGLQKDLPVEEMEKLLLANLPAGDEELRLLARQRAENVQTWLIEQGKVAAERIFLVPGKAKAEAPAAAGGRVEFALR